MNVNEPSSSSGLGRLVLSQETGVRFPMTVPKKAKSVNYKKVVEQWYLGHQVMRELTDSEEELGFLLQISNSDMDTKLYTILRMEDAVALTDPDEVIRECKREMIIMGCTREVSEASL